MANKTVFKSTTFNVGDTTRVKQKIKEGGKERIQIFEGIVIKIKGSQENKSFTIRRIGIGGIGIEKIWPLSLPSLQSIKVLKKGKVRRAKLYYLRKRVGKKATRVKENRVRADLVSTRKKSTKSTKDKKHSSDKKTEKSRKNRGTTSKKAASK